jgi:hypothetical protein
MTAGDHLQQPDHDNVPRRTRADTTPPARRTGTRATHHGRNPFSSATHGPMRRDHALERFLHLTAKYRRD